MTEEKRTPDDELRERLAKMFANVPEETRDMYGKLFMFFGEMDKFLERVKAEQEGDIVDEQAC